MVGTATNGNTYRRASSFSDWDIKPQLLSGMKEMGLIQTGIYHGRGIRFDAEDLEKY